MARIRYIKPEFYSDTTLSEVSIISRYFYAGLFCQMDRQGVCEADPKLLKREIFPYDDDVSPKVVDDLINELVRAGRLVRFEQGRKRYLYCPKLIEHQNFHKDEKVKYPFSPEYLSRLLEPDHPDTVPAPCKPGAPLMPKSIDIDAKTTETETETEIGTETGTETGTLLAPGSSNPDAGQQSFLPGKEPRDSIDPEGPSPTALTWRSYRDAYRTKYGEAPLFNPKIGGQLKSFVSRVPKEEAPLIAAFYLTHSDQFYVKKMHPIGLLLQDAEKLRTEWATGRKMTGFEAHQSEQRDANVEAMKKYLARKGIA